MSYIDKKSCLTCAWRETCQKRFSSIEDMGSRCPEYTYDIRLDKQKNQTPDTDPKNKKSAGGLGPKASALGGHQKEIST